MRVLFAMLVACATTTSARGADVDLCKAVISFAVRTTLAFSYPFA